MMEFVSRLISSFFGVFGFSIFFNMKKERLLHAAILGTISCAILWYCEKLFPGNIFLTNFIPALIATILSELSARWKKAPATIFILPALLVLIPGSSFYYTMSYLVIGNQELFREWGSRTVQSALGISVGILIASLLFYEVLSLIQSVQKPRH